MDKWISYEDLPEDSSFLQGNPYKLGIIVCNTYTGNTHDMCRTYNNGKRMCRECRFKLMSQEKDIINKHTDYDGVMDGRTVFKEMQELAILTLALG